MERRSLLVAALVTAALLASAALLLVRERGEGARGDAPPATAGAPGSDGDRSSALAGESEGSGAGTAPRGQRGRRGSVASPRGGRSGAESDKRDAPAEAAESASPADGAPPGLEGGNAAFAITVVGPDSSPVAAAVAIRGQGGSLEVRTGPEGAAAVEGIAAGAYEIEVRAAAAPPLRSVRPVDVGPAERAEVRCVVSSFDGEALGRVLDGAGRPLEGVVVEARPLPAGGPGPGFVPVEPPKPVKSAADGSFHLLGLSRGEHYLSTVGTEPRRPAAATALAAPGGGEPVDLIVLDRVTLVISGRVTDVSGNPLEGAQVSVTTHRAAQALADAGGRFTLDVDYDRGGLVVSARAEGHAPAQLLLTAADLRDRDAAAADLKLEPLGDLGRVAGRITDDSGRGLAGQVLLLYSSSLAASYQGRSGADGTFGIEEVRPAADYRAWVSPERSFRDWSRAPVEIAPGENGLDVVLERLPTGRLSGRFLDKEGRPLAGLTLWARSGQAAAAPVRVSSDASGRFESVEVPAGPISLESRAAPWITVRGVEVPVAAETRVEVPVGVGAGSLSGAVRGASGEPLAGARVSLSWSEARSGLNSTAYRESMSDARGRFSFKNLPRGAATLTLSATGHIDLRVSRELSGAAEEAAFDLAAEPPR